MSQFQISLLDKRLIQHLIGGGAIDDEAGTAIVMEIVFNTWNASGVSENATQLGFSIAHLAAIYTEATKALGPNPLIRHGGKIIATSLVFMDFPKFPAFLQIITRFGQLRPERPDDLETIGQNAIEAVRSIFEEANTKRGQPDLSSATGCLIAVTSLVGVMGLMVVLSLHTAQAVLF